SGAPLRAKAQLRRILRIEHTHIIERHTHPPRRVVPRLVFQGRQSTPRHATRIIGRQSTREFFPPETFGLVTGQVHLMPTRHELANHRLEVAEVREMQRGEQDLHASGTLAITRRFLPYAPAFTKNCSRSAISSMCSSLRPSTSRRYQR